MRPIHQPLALMLAALCLAACGKEAATQTRPVAVAPAPVPSTVGLPLPAPNAAPADAAHDTLMKAMAAYKAMPAFEAKMAFMQKQGGTSAKGVYALGSQQPRTLRIAIEAGNSQGTHILWRGGDSVKVRPPGLLGAITVDLPQTDERLKSVRGYVLSDTDFPAMFSYMQDAANKLSPPQQTADGLVLHSAGTKFPKGVVAMNAYFDPATMLPRKVEMLDSKEVVLRFVISGLTKKSSISLDI